MGLYIIDNTMSWFIRKIMRLAKKEEEHHVPTQKELDKENADILIKEKKLAKLLKPDGKSLPKSKKTKKTRRKS